MVMMSFLVMVLVFVIGKVFGATGVIVDLGLMVSGSPTRPWTRRIALFRTERCIMTLALLVFIGSTC